MQESRSYGPVGEPGEVTNRSTRIIALRYSMAAVFCRTAKAHKESKVASIINSKSKSFSICFSFRYRK